MMNISFDDDFEWIDEERTTYKHVLHLFTF